MEKALSAFLSHSNLDEPQVKIVQRFLSDIGIRPWASYDDIHRSEYDEVIARQIMSSDIFILILTSNSANSRKVKGECLFADDLDNKVFAVYELEKMEKEKIPAGLRLRLAGKQHILTHKYPNSLEKLAQFIFTEKGLKWEDYSDRAEDAASRIRREILEAKKDRQRKLQEYKELYWNCRTRYGKPRDDSTITVNERQQLSDLRDRLGLSDQDISRVRAGFDRRKKADFTKLFNSTLNHAIITREDLYQLERKRIGCSVSTNEVEKAIGSRNRIPPTDSEIRLGMQNDKPVVIPIDIGWIIDSLDRRRKELIPTKTQPPSPKIETPVPVLIDADKPSKVAVNNWGEARSEDEASETSAADEKERRERETLERAAEKENARQVAVTQERGPKEEAPHFGPNDAEPVLKFETCIQLSEEENDSLGAWADILEASGSLDETIEQLLNELTFPSKIVQGGKQITSANESKCVKSHQIDLAQSGKLLLRINTSAFSGKNGILVFERFLSVKNFLESPHIYQFYQKTSDSVLSLDVAASDDGFALNIQRRHLSLNSVGSVRSHEFTQLAAWDYYIREKIESHLKPLVQALAEKECLKQRALASIEDIQRILQLAQKHQLGVYRIVGSDFLSLNPKLRQNAASRICNSHVCPSDVYLVVDQSMWSDCKEGIAFTRQGVFSKLMFSSHCSIPWSKVSNIRPPSTQGSALLINDIRVEIASMTTDSASDSISIEKILEIGNKVGALAYAAAELFSGKEYEDTNQEHWLDILAKETAEINHSLSRAFAKWRYFALLVNGRQTESQNLADFETDLLWKLSSCINHLLVSFEASEMRPHALACAHELNTIYGILVNRLEAGDHSEDDMALCLFLRSEMLTKLRMHRQAIPLRKRELIHSRKRYGDRHPGTLLSIRNLASDLYEVGELDAAKLLLEELVHARREELSPGDQLIREALTDLALTLESLGQLDDAAKHYRDALDQCLSTVGVDDWHTLLNRFYIGRVCYGLGLKRKALDEIDLVIRSLSKEQNLDADGLKFFSEVQALKNKVDQLV